MGYTTFSTLYLFAGEHTRFRASLLIPTEAVGGTLSEFPSCLCHIYVLQRWIITQLLCHFSKFILSKKCNA